MILHTSTQPLAFGDLFQLGKGQLDGAVVVARRRIDGFKLPQTFIQIHVHVVRHAERQTPPGAWPIRRSTSSKGISLALVRNVSLYLRLSTFAVPSVRMSTALSPCKKDMVLAIMPAERPTPARLRRLLRWKRPAR